MKLEYIVIMYLNRGMMFRSLSLITHPIWAIGQGKQGEDGRLGMEERKCSVCCVTQSSLSVFH